MTTTYLSVADLAARWDINRSAVYRRIAEKRLAALHIGQAIRVPIVEVERFEAENTTPVEGRRNSRRTA
ncbi:helix-turn-helix domain-containing protein [Rhodococcus jostii]|uniref:helix-turn-helix domain-containing protein n=1 Tax=Rhodococcus jostii TaxID=132919 RepID=UPI003630EF61